MYQFLSEGCKKPPETRSMGVRQGFFLPKGCIRMRKEM